MLRVFRVTAIAATLAVAGQPSVAEVPTEVDALLQAMDVPDLMEIMREEGIEYGDLLEEQLFPDRGGSAWAAVVQQTYDASTMYDVFAARFAEELDGKDVAQMTEFFTSDRGARIVDYELSARRALLDDGIEEAAIETLQEKEAASDARLAQVKEFIDVNDLVESNVMGAMNANFAFYTGLLDGNAFPRQLSEEQVLSDVWSQEAEIRADTIEWINSYLLMAYQPLSDEDLEVYTAMASTAAGQDLNAALFAAFDEVFVGISRTLGFAAARFIAGQDI